MILTTTPPLTPVDFATPLPRISILPCSLRLPITQTIFVVPISNPQLFCLCSFFTCLYKPPDLRIQHWPFWSFSHFHHFPDRNRRLLVYWAFLSYYPVNPIEPCDFRRKDRVRFCCFYSRGSPEYTFRKRGRLMFSAVAGRYNRDLTSTLPVINGTIAE